MQFVISLLLIFASSLAFSQDSDVQKWQQNHPDVVFIEHDVFSNFNNQQVEQLGDKIIIYTDDISIGDISLYETNQNLIKNADATVAPNLKESIVIKEWLSLNKGVKIIKRSYYNSITVEKQNLYINVNAMILIGETITISDIKAYTL